MSSLAGSILLLNEKKSISRIQYILGPMLYGKQCMPIKILHLLGNYVPFAVWKIWKCIYIYSSGVSSENSNNIIHSNRSISKRYKRNQGSVWPINILLHRVCGLVKWGQQLEQCLHYNEYLSSVAIFSDHNLGFGLCVIKLSSLFSSKKKKKKKSSLVSTSTPNNHT